MIDLKDDIVLKDVLSLQPRLFIILGYFYMYAKEHKLPMRITSVISDRGDIQIASKTHEQGRAIDLSSQGWSRFHIERVVFHVNKRCKALAAISAKDLIPRAVVYHDSGYGAHFHLQCRP